MPPAPIVVDDAEGENMNEAQLINEVRWNLWFFSSYALDIRQEDRS